jgi:hypothetical protein
MTLRNRPARRRAWCLACAAGLAALALAGPAAAQEPEKPLPPMPPLPGQGPVEQPSGAQEMVELFHKVERRLREIDALLYEAGSGEAAIGELEESGIEDLIRRSKAGSKGVVEDIDRILEIASQNGGT